MATFHYGVRQVGDAPGAVEPPPVRAGYRRDVK